MSFLATAVVVVAGRSMITRCAPRSGRVRRPWSRWAGECSWAPPDTSVTCQHLVGRTGAPRARTVRLGPALGRPVSGDGIEDPPRELDLLVPREERGLAEQHGEDEPLVRLG